MTSRKCLDFTKNNHPCANPPVIDCEYCYMHLIHPNTMPYTHPIKPISLSSNYLLILPMDITELLHQYLEAVDSMQLTDEIKEWKCLQDRVNYWRVLYGKTFSKKFPKTKNLQALYRTNKLRLQNAKNKLPYILNCNWEITCEQYFDYKNYKEPYWTFAGVIDDHIVKAIQNGKIDQLTMLWPYANSSTRLICNRITQNIRDVHIKNKVEKFLKDHEDTKPKFSFAY